MWATYTWGLLNHNLNCVPHIFDPAKEGIKDDMLHRDSKPTRIEEVQGAR